jgi:hypothetical protein
MSSSRALRISAAMRDWVRVSPGMRFVYDAWERKPINRTIACNGDLELQPRVHDWLKFKELIRLRLLHLIREGERTSPKAWPMIRMVLEVVHLL